MESPPADAKRVLRVLNLGGGVQSSAMCLMFHRGDIGPPPDLMLHADTKSDPPEVMRLVEWLAELVAWPTRVVSAGGGVADDLAAGLDADGRPDSQTIPAFLIDDQGRRAGMGMRFCTSQYKIKPIEKGIREFLGISKGQRMPKGQHVQHLFGISIDEFTRMKPNRVAWAWNSYPLIDADLSRADCLAYWQEHAPADAPPIGRSACYICPYRSAKEWRDLQDAHPDLVQRAAEVEVAMQSHEKGGYQVFLHARRIPLLQALEADRVLAESQPALWEEECDGYCGT